MTDPVDTNALMDLARAAHGGASELWEAWDEGTARLLRSSAIEIDGLRTVIENAPHDAECEQWDLQPQTGRPLTDACTCWKADAL